MGEGEQSVKHDRVALVIQDRAAKYMDSFPASSNDAHSSYQAFHDFYGDELEKRPRNLYSDKSKEL